MGWKAVISSAVTLVALGVFIDAWMTVKQKVGLCDRLCRWFLRLEDSTVPDLPLIMVKTSVRFVQIASGGKLFSLRLFLWFSVLSGSLTVSALILGPQMWPRPGIPGPGIQDILSVDALLIFLPVKLVFDGIAFLSP